MLCGVCKRDKIKFYICNCLRNRNEIKFKILYNNSVCCVVLFGNDESGKYFLYNRRFGLGRMFYFVSYFCKLEYFGMFLFLLYYYVL